MQISTTAVLGLTAIGGLCAQSWEDRVEARWPGAAILKVTEQEFTSFLHQNLAQLGDKAAGVGAFQSAQARAYGLPHAAGFLFPTPPAVLPESGLSLNAAISEANEPNGDPNSGGGIPTLISVGDEGQGHLSPGDDDWWRFSVTRRFDLIINTTRIGTANVSDTVIELYDVGSNLLAANDDFLGYGLYSRLDVTLDTGVYYVKVRAFSPTQEGEYGLDIHEPLPSSGLQTVAEGPEDNGDPNNGGTPTPADCNTRCLGNIESGTDTDWWSFTLTADTDVVLQTGPDNPGGAEVGDSTMTLRDAMGASIEFDDDDGPGLYSFISRTLTAGTYYVEVDGFGSTRTGYYNLDILCLGGTVPASYTITGQGCAGSNGNTPFLSVGDPEQPVIGTTFSVRCNDLNASMPTIASLGFSQTLDGGFQCPLDLTPFGAPGCTVYSDSVVSFVLVVDPVTSSSLISVEIPREPSIEGVVFYEQVYVLDPAANAFGAYMSDALVGVLGRRD